LGLEPNLAGANLAAEPKKSPASFGAERLDGGLRLKLTPAQVTSCDSFLARFLDYSPGTAAQGARGGRLGREH